MINKPNDPTLTKIQSRRNFLKKTAGTSLAATLAGPTILNASNKSGSRKPILGENAFQYEVTHNWGELPQNLQWGDTHGVARDESGLIYVKHRHLHLDEPMDTIVVLDEKGKFVRSFGKEFHRGGHGIDIRKEGNEEFLYLSDIIHNLVAKCTLKGELVWAMDAPLQTGVYMPGMKCSPTNVAFAPDGGFYVSDGYGSYFIHHYDKDRNWLRSWGGKGNEPGKMHTPHSIWLDDRPGRKPSLVVADRANARLQYFSLYGEHLGFVEGLLFPADIDIQGEIMLVPDLHARITLFDIDNNVITHLGDDPVWREKVLKTRKPKIRTNPKSWVAGKFIHPHDACFDHNGNIIVTEWVSTGRVSFLRKLS